MTDAGTIERLALFVGLVATLAGILTGIGSTYYLRSKDRREAKAQKNDDIETLITVKDSTIDTQREQIEMLMETLESERAETKAAQERQRLREEKMEKRLDELERDYRNLVLTVTTMSFCANASTCPNNDPGDRRKRSVSTKPGATD